MKNAAAGDGGGPDDGPGEPGAEVDNVHPGHDLLSLRWRVRDLAIARFLREGVPYEQQLAALRVLMMTETDIIVYHWEVPTEPGVICDAARVHQELERRGDFGEMLRHQLALVHGGIGGFLRRFLGQGPVNAKKLEERLWVEAREDAPGYRPAPLFALIDSGDYARAYPLVSHYFLWHRPRAQQQRQQ